MTGWRHPCDQHPTWCHTEECLASPCGFCGRELDEIPSGECRTCGRIVCEECDGGYDLALGGAICRPCAGITTRGSHARPHTTRFQHHQITHKGET